MNESLNRNNLLSLVSMMLIISGFLFIIVNNLPYGLGSNRFLWSPLWLLGILLMKPKVYTYKLVLFVLFYGVVFVFLLPNTLWRYTNDFYIASILNEFYSIIVAITVVAYFLLTKDYKTWGLIGVVGFISVIITASMTLIATQFFPSIVRASVSENFTYTSDYSFFSQIGAGGYGFAQSLVVLVPIIVFFIKNETKSKTKKVVFFIILSLVFITIVRMQLFANILVSLIILTVAFLGNHKQKSSLVLIIGSLLFLTMVSTTYISAVVKEVSLNFEPESEMYLKLNDLSILIESSSLDDEGSITSRAERYPQLWETFIDNPLDGSASNPNHNSRSMHSGGHLYWMSRLTLWGLPMFLVFLFILYKLFYHVGSVLTSDYRFYFHLSVLSIILLGFMKNIGGREVVYTLFLIIPGLYFYIKNVYSIKNKLK
ncbi:MAG: hypothetical protein J0L60_13555 [Ignavibacteria bacterium]|nr:hypothetical protein [Ignavibacteria bacterium]